MKVQCITLREEYLELVRQWRMREDITKYMNTDINITRQEQKIWFEKINKDKTQHYWIILVDDIPVGLINIFNIDDINKRCSWGWYIAKLKIRSLKLAMTLEWNLYDYVFETLKLHKLCNETFVENKYVIKLHQLCGSHEDGILREHIYKNGNYFDISVGSILSKEWKKKKETIQFEKIIFE